MPKFVSKKPGGMMAFLAALGLKQMAADAEPEELQAAIDAMAGESGEEEPAKDADPAIEALSAKLDQLAAVVAKLAGANEPAPEDVIDAEIAKLEASADDENDEEESHTIPAENMDEGGPVQPAEERPKDPITGDNAHKIAALRAIKPVIAAIQDPAARKQAADAAIASIKTKPPSNTYAAIKPKKPTQDGKTPTVVDQSQIGRDIAKKWNPHYKERA